jgi:mannose-1-phosphate guanylyltransferase
MTTNVPFHPIILAGGSGTRFWPRSRRWRAKQLLVLDGARSMIQSTVDRLGNLANSKDLWVITNDLLSEAISTQLHTLLGEHMVCEPAARNTAPAAGLAAFLIERTSPEAVLGVFPSDHVVTDDE